ncbi:hypothetical protein [Acidicapsa ligni]|uniref:hypothetical protein n=1 Tax=Acidicapsa ligni TaxID=542300 RepID=UPI0021DFA09F|nr:hypothetical protein [Acidicapsa ligni]
MGLIGPGKTSANNTAEIVVQRYTEEARRALYFARHEAQRRREMTVTVADLLSGISVEENSRAVRIGHLKDNAFYLRWLSGLPASPSQVAPNHDGHPDLDHVARKAIACALLEADYDREYWIDTDHLLRGLLRFHNTANFALLKTELSLDAARKASRHDRKAFPPHKTPNMKVINYLVRKHAALWLPPLLSAACYLYILLQSVDSSVLRFAH